MEEISLFMSICWPLSRTHTPYFGKRGVTSGPAQEVVRGVDKAPADKEEEEEEEYEEDPLKPTTSESGSSQRKKQVVRKTSRHVREVFSTGEEESATYIPPLDLLIATSPHLEETREETAQAFGKVVFCHLSIVLFFLF